MRVGELARHWNAAQPIDLAKAIGYSRQAGDAALRALAPADALRYYAQALDLQAEADDPDPVVGLDLAIGLGTAQRQTGDPTYRETLLDAARRAAALGDTDRLVAAALANNRGWFSAAGVIDTEKVEVLEIALDRLPADHIARALVLSTLCSELAYGSPLERRQALADEAVAIAESSGDDALIVRVLNNLVAPLLVPSLHEQSLTRTADSLVRAERVGDPVLLFFAVFWRAYVASQASDIDELDRCLDIMASLAERLDQPMLTWSDTAYRSARALIAGDTDRAEELANDALKIGTDGGQPDASIFFGTHLIGVNQRRGTLGELASLLEQMAADAPTVAGALTAVVALAHAEADRIEDAARLLEELATTDFELPLDSVWLTTVVEYADAAIEVQDPKYARPLFDLLVPWADQFASIGMAGAEGPVSHYLGGLATVLGRYGEADSYFAHAAAVNDRAGAKFFAARTDLCWGQMLSKRDAPGDAETGSGPSHPGTRHSRGTWVRERGATCCRGSPRRGLSLSGGRSTLACTLSTHPVDEAATCQNRAMRRWRHAAVVLVMLATVGTTVGSAWGGGRGGGGGRHRPDGPGCIPTRALERLRLHAHVHAGCRRLHRRRRHGVGDRLGGQPARGRDLPGRDLLRPGRHLQGLRLRHLRRLPRRHGWMRTDTFPRRSPPSGTPGPSSPSLSSPTSWYSAAMPTSPCTAGWRCRTRPTDVVTANPEASAGLVPLNTAPDAVAAPRDGRSTTTSWPSTVSETTTRGPAPGVGRRRRLRSALRRTCGRFWNQQLAGIAEISVPDSSLDDAYRSGFIYTQIARSGDELHTGVNGYESEFSHDVIGILTNLFTQGYFSDAQALLLEARNVDGLPGQYDDGIWTYALPWAIYLMKTGDLALRQGELRHRGPPRGLAAEHRGHRPRHRRRPDRTRRGSWRQPTTSTPRATGRPTITRPCWAWPPTATWPSASGTLPRPPGRPQQYDSLLSATNQTLDTTIQPIPPGLPALLASSSPTRANRCRESRGCQLDVAARRQWAWNGSLFGATRQRPGHLHDRRHLCLRVRSPEGHASARHLRWVPGRLLLDRLQRRVRDRRAGQHTPPGPGDPELRVHDRQQPERPVLVVGELDRAPRATRHGSGDTRRRARAPPPTPGGWPRPTASCWTHWWPSAPTGPLIVGRGVPCAMAERWRQAIAVTQLPDHRRPAAEPSDRSGRPVGDPHTQRCAPDRARALPTSVVHRLYRVDVIGGRRPRYRDRGDLGHDQTRHRPLARSRRVLSALTPCRRKPGRQGVATRCRPSSPGRAGGGPRGFPSPADPPNSQAGLVGVEWGVRRRRLHRGVAHHRPRR